VDVDIRDQPKAGPRRQRIARTAASVNETFSARPARTQAHIPVSKMSGIKTTGVLDYFDLS